MKPNIKALEEWIAVLEAAPAEKINQNYWARTAGAIDPATGYLCATAACAGGWATLVP